MKKIVINTCYGGFSLSTEATRAYLTLKNIPFEERTGEYNDIMFCQPGGPDWSLYDLISEIDRSDPCLIEVVETLGDVANGMCARLKISEVPKGTLYRITEYDGLETIETLETLDTTDWKIA
jgi:hypothetical protein